MAKDPEATFSGTVYRISNKLNGKCYIGQTKRSVHVRFNKHKYQAATHSSNSNLHKAFRKYGVENFCFMPIHEDIPTAASLDELEKYYISLYDSINTGYNICIGGGSYVRSRETLDKLSKASLGRKHTEATKELMRSKAVGRTHSSETKEKARVRMLGNKMSDSNVIIECNKARADSTTYEFYHPVHGEAVMSPRDLADCYGLRVSACHRVAKGSYSSTSGWVLSTNKNLLCRRSVHTIHNNITGKVLQGTCKELGALIGVTADSITGLIRGKSRQTRSGWVLKGNNNG